MSSMRGARDRAAIGLSGQSGGAGGQSIADAEVLFEIKAPDAKDPKAAPQIEATVIGAPNLPAERFALVDERRPGRRSRSRRCRGALSQGPRLLALAIVLMGGRCGSATTATGPKQDMTRTPACCPARGHDRQARPQSFGPPGSVGAVITYATSAQVRVPMGPIAADRPLARHPEGLPEHRRPRAREGVEPRARRAPQGDAADRGADRDRRRQ